MLQTDSDSKQDCDLFPHVCSSVNWQGCVRGARTSEHSGLKYYKFLSWPYPSRILFKQYCFWNVFLIF